LQVLSGSSLQVTYEFVEKQRLTSYLGLGRLAVRDVEVLHRGDVREVQLGRDYIHAVCHLERPSVSLLVATRSPSHYAMPFTYTPPGLAVMECFEEARLTKQLGALDLIARAQPERYEASLSRYVAQADAMYAYFALRQGYAELDEAVFARVLEAARETHPELADVWIEAFAERRRIEDLRARRPFVRRPEHRLLLGLLQNVPTADAIFRVVREQCPGADAVLTIIGWLRELMAIEVEGPGGPNALGVSLDEAALRILEGLMRGHDGQALFDSLRGEYEPSEIDAQRAEIAELCDCFRESPLFRPLLPKAEKTSAPGRVLAPPYPLSA
jgi:hypothetical protein